MTIVEDLGFGQGIPANRNQAAQPAERFRGLWARRIDWTRRGCLHSIPHGDGNLEFNTFWEIYRL
jgi:hypothetical protein